MKGLFPRTAYIAFSQYKESAPKTQNVATPP